MMPCNNKSLQSRLQRSAQTSVLTFFLHLRRYLGFTTVHLSLRMTSAHYLGICFARLDFCRQRAAVREALRVGRGLQDDSMSCLQGQIVSHRAGAATGDS